MVNPLPLIVSTAAFLTRTPHAPSSTSVAFHTRSSKPDAFVRLQSKMIDKAEEILEKIQHDDEEELETSSNKSEFDNPLLDLLPLPKVSSDDEEENEQQDEEMASAPRDQSLSFDSQDQWKTAESDLSDFWSRILDGNVDAEDESNGEDNGKSHGNNVADNDVDISDSTVANSNTDKEAFEDYGEKASNRHPNVEDEENSDTPSFGVAAKILEPLEGLLTNNDNDSNQEGIASILESRAKSWMGYLSLPGGGTEQSIQDMINTARQSVQDGGSDVADEKSFQEILGILRQYSAEIKGTVDKYFADMDLSTLRPTSLFYYLEKEDEHKNPSWKRRMHRFYPGVGVERMNELNDALTLSQVAYMDSVEEAKERLESLTDPYELIYCNLVGEPNQPAHYVAVKQHQDKSSPALELVLGVRGTKTITDAITDLLCEDEDYRGGKAHSGVLASGKYIAEKHTPLLQELLDSSGKQRIKIQLSGHSLGAGAAAIAAMEFNDQPNIDVEVVGFGSPAMLSQELSEAMQDYMTTVVADDDVVPRLSAPTVINALLDVMEYDYIPR